MQDTKRLDIIGNQLETAIKEKDTFKIFKISLALSNELDRIILQFKVKFNLNKKGD